MQSLEEFLKESKAACRVCAKLLPKERNQILCDMAEELSAHEAGILRANALDFKEAQNAGIKEAFLDRLLLNHERICAMSQALRAIAELKNPIGRVLDGWVAENGLRIEKVSVPLGVVGIIYESRPNVTSDTAALCFKSGNVCVLKGGKEAQRSNEAIAGILQDVLEAHHLPRAMIALLPDYSREGVAQFMKMDRYVDLLIPRGGESLINFVAKNATIPVIKHDKGVCHLYIHEDADYQKALAIAINAKASRPSACNAIETLLVDRAISGEFLQAFAPLAKEAGIALRACEESLKFIEGSAASEEDFSTEYGEKILNIKVVADIDEALAHIARYGSGHSEAIVSENHASAERFLDEVDAASIYLNASTRFSDGGEYGFGAEVGISTNKLHARGPMGINELTTYKYKVYGSGQVRG